MVNLCNRSTSSQLSLPRYNISSTLDRVMMELKMVCIILHFFIHIEKFLKIADSIYIWVPGIEKTKYNLFS